MIPPEVAVVANFVMDEFNINFDDAVSAAWKLFNKLQESGYTVIDSIEAKQP